MKKIVAFLVLVLVLGAGYLLYSGKINLSPKEEPLWKKVYGPDAQAIKKTEEFFANVNPNDFPFEKDIVRDPADLPPPITRKTPALVDVTITVREKVAEIAPGVTYLYYTYNDKVPGPFVRVRVGDTLRVTFINDSKNKLGHAVDFHAVTGPGGGSLVLQTAPGQTAIGEFKLLQSGLFFYHGALPPVSTHVTNGAHGLILVEPEEGLPPVDKEFYLVQNELYTDKPMGEKGFTKFSIQNLINEKVEYYFWNGAAYSTTEKHIMKAKTGERVRIFFGNSGDSKISSFHIIGVVWDALAIFGHDGKMKMGSDTLSVPDGSAAMVEFPVPVPGTYILVDHALARLERGAFAALRVEGPENPEVYKKIK